MYQSRNLFAWWRRAAGDLAVLLLFGQLLVAYLFYWGSWRRAVTPVEIASEIALLIGVYGVLSALLAVPVAAIASLLQTRKPRMAAALAATYTHVCLLVAVVLVHAFAAGWLRATIKGIEHLVPGRVMVNLPELVLLGACAAWALVIWRRGWIGAAEAASRRLRVVHAPALVVLAIAAAGLAVTGHAAIRPFGWASQPAAQVGASAEPARPDVYLITVDTLAAQDMSLYGYPLKTTPELERFAERAYVFDRFQANSNWTQPTITSIMTGLYPDTHRVNPNNAKLDPQSVGRTLPAMLRAAGYRTAAITSNTVAHPLTRGFGTAFDYLSEPINQELWRPLQRVITLHKSHLVGPAEFWWYQPFERLIKAALPRSQQRRNLYPAEPLIERTLEVARAGAGPRFVWTHFFAPHAPYLPPDPFRNQFLASEEFSHWDDFPNRQYDVATEQPMVDRLRLRYDEFVAYADRAVGRLIDELERSGALARSIVIVTSDHGESFSHGWIAHHGPIMTQGVLHVPLLIRVPGQAQGARIASAGEQVDLLPTILDLAGLQVPEWAEGKSLRPLMEPGGEAPDRPTFSYELTTASRFTAPESGAFAVLLGRHKLVHRLRSGCEELYDLDADPGETRNLAAESTERVVALRALLERRRGSALPGSAPANGQPCKLAFPEAF